MKQTHIDESRQTNGSLAAGLNSQKSISGSLETIAHDAGKAIGKAASRIVDANSELKIQGREYIQQNPAKSVAFAMAAGLLVGGLFVLARRDRG